MGKESMEKPLLLHMITPGKNVSPFDVNMAYDAGWNALIPYTGVETPEVASLVQDAIFSRGPKGVRRTGMFIGGRDTGAAMDMLEAARSAMVPPFEVSVFADPSGAFTTSAALVAVLEKQLRTHHGTELQGQRALVFGGTGPVGIATSVLAARVGAEVTIVSHTGLAHAADAARACGTRYGARIAAADGSTDALKTDLLRQADVIFGTAAAGVQILTLAQLQAAPDLKLVGDLNAVPPLGVEGVELFHNGDPLAGLERVRGVGALAVGNVKYHVQQALFRLMVESDKPLFLDFQDAFEVARSHVADS